MTKDKVLEVLKIYRAELERRGITKLENPSDRFDADVLIPDDHAYFSIKLTHCYEMLNSIEEFARADRMEKAFRWLGFIQGCFWSCGVYTIQEMKNHNRPDPE